MTEQLGAIHEQSKNFVSGTADFLNDRIGDVTKIAQTGVGTAQDALHRGLGAVHNTMLGSVREAAERVSPFTEAAHNVVSGARSPEAKAQAEANERYAEGFDQAIEEAKKTEEKRRAAQAPAASPATGGKKRRRGGTKKKGRKHKKKTQKKHHKKKHHKKKHHKKKHGGTIKKGAGHKRVGGTKKKCGRKGKGKK